jgi:hypothetical protein
MLGHLAIGELGQIMSDPADNIGTDLVRDFCPQITKSDRPSHNAASVVAKTSNSRQERP